jgi:hypothetical protein
MREARYAVTKTKFQWRLTRLARYAVTKTGQEHENEVSEEANARSA